MQNLSPRRIVPLIFLLLIVIAGSVYLFSISGAQDGPLQASGTVEAVEVHVAPEIGGRVLDVYVQEGIMVEVDQALFRLDDTLQLAQRDQAEAALAAAQATLATAEAAVETAKVQLDLTLMQARLTELPALASGWQQQTPPDFELPIWYFEQEEQIQAAQAELETAEQALMEARQTTESILETEIGVALVDAETRLLRALEAYNIAQQVLDRTRLAWNNQNLLDAAQERFDEAQDELEAAQGSYDDLLTDDQAEQVLDARAHLATAQARYDAAHTLLDSLLTGEHSLLVRAAEAAFEQAQAGAAQAQAAVTLAETEFQLLELQIEKLLVKAPVAGLVLTRSIEPGEVVQPGAAAIAISLVDDLRITVFIPEDRYGDVSLDASVEISVDSFPDQTFTGRVIRIADRAEFTPRNVQTQEGRRTTVFAVEISVSDPGGWLKPGMPADVLFPEQ